MRMRRFFTSSAFFSWFFTESWGKEQLGGASADAQSYWQGRFAACAFVDDFLGIGRPRDSWGHGPPGRRGPHPPDGGSQGAGSDAGRIAQNIYLYGASEGLGVVVHASVDRDTISKVLKLRPAQHIMIAQTVGIPTR